MIKNLLIDLDGTLTDPKEGITASARYGLAKVGHPIADTENIDWIIGPPLKASLAKLLHVDVHDVLAEQALAGYRERFAATGKPEIYARQILDHFDLLQYFEYPYGSELNGERTNKADLIAYILQQEQLQPEQCLMIGDREHDILGARANGVDCVAVEYGYGSAQELDLAAPKHRIQCFAQILSVLEQLSG